jgi:predicted alpha-1,6-mannanase (GH76 family)
MTVAAHQTFFKKNKYNAHHKEYGGSMYHSTKEADHARLLDTLKKAATPAQRVVRWERQVKVRLELNGKLITHWYCDFRVWFADGHDEWHEVKGIKTEAYRLKEKMFLAQYPDRLLLIL